ncbi:glycoside hydrolase family 5 protein [Artomyces pyxidatus]|uniref:Glycoside hydrolase family 5 protein n=1 Tax=Artomyces pyxidatus TaxID=48021 RepID=A0ACB8TGD0_9AGAM|nr:glycoside hydrolase family 5 protein [Artomyces pyxidatus]
MRCHHIVSSVLLILGFALNAYGAQQCRLVLPAALDEPPPTPTPTAIATTSASASTPSVTPFTAFQYGTTPIRGVNLGGWFVLEPWITPSIFENTNNTAIVDEYTFGLLQDNATALAALQQHWSTWITEDDFIAIAAAGLTHVRIPVGYWSVPTSTNGTFPPYISGAYPYLQQAVQWARAHNIHVIIDLHGAPGSQNGYDNSGQRTSSPSWALNQANIAATLETINVLAGLDVDAVELLNEVAGFLGSVWDTAVRAYWKSGYGAVRQVGGNNMQVVIGDAFEGVSAWEGFLPYGSSPNVIMDYHEYQIFSDPELARSQAEHLAFACTLLPPMQALANTTMWTITGEWSTAITDCAIWLNGRGVGARWDGTYGDGAPAFGSCDGYTGDSSTFSEDYKTFMRQYWEVQVEIGEAVQGWIYWTWKTESADEWSYQKGLEGGWIPQDPSQRLYPGLCSGNSTGS